MLNPARWLQRRRLACRMLVVREKSDARCDYLPDLNSPFLLRLQILFVDANDIIGTQSSYSLDGLTTKSWLLPEQIDLVDGPFG